MKRCHYNAAFSKSHECIFYCSSLVLFFVFSGAARHRRTWTARPLSALPWTTSNVLDPESSWEEMCSASSEPYTCLTQKTELVLFICFIINAQHGIKNFFFGIKTENTKIFPFILLWITYYSIFFYTNIEKAYILLWLHILYIYLYILFSNSEYLNIIKS